MAVNSIDACTIIYFKFKVLLLLLPPSSHPCTFFVRFSLLFIAFYSLLFFQQKKSIKLNDLFVESIFFPFLVLFLFLSPEKKKYCICLFDIFKLVFYLKIFYQQDKKIKRKKTFFFKLYISESAVQSL